MKPITLFVGAMLAVGATTYVFWPRAQTPSPDATSGTPLADVVVPDSFSSAAQIGKVAFEAKCAACHGTNAAGQQGVAPPLVHIIYEPSHHDDESFQRAAAMGVQSHHWRFGNMPPLAGMTRGDIAMVTAYIRELQQANGIN